MPALQPFHFYLTEKQQLHNVVAPPYDVLTRQQAHTLAQGKPNSILSITRADKAYPLTTDENAPEVLQLAQSALKKALESGLFQAESAASYGIYQLSSPTHCQTGIVSLTSAAKLKAHEQTKPNKVENRMQLCKMLKAQVSPVIICYKHKIKIKEQLQHITQSSLCHYEVTDKQGYSHRLWLVKPEQISAAVAQIDSLYIADGHHRSASMIELAKQTGQTDDILSVAFPDNELQLLGYHRLIKTTRSPQAILKQLKAKLTLTPSDPPVLPELAHEFGLYLDKQWYRLTAFADSTQLASQLLHQQIIEPIFEIHDLRQDPAIDFIGGINACHEIEQLIDNDEFQLALTLAPTPIAAILDCADRAEVMPPKSTWFEPKLLDGLFLLKQS